MVKKEIEMATNQVYLDIVKKWGAPESRKILNIIEATFSPEEGKVLLELFMPATAKDVAKKLNTDEKKILPILEGLAERGVITKGKTQYCFHQSLIAFHHHVFGGIAREPVPEKLEKLWKDFFYDEWSDMFIQGYINRMQTTGWPVHRVWPHVGALELSPNIKPEQIIPEEDFKLKLKNTKRIIVGHCGCRKNWGKWSECEHPEETCFAPLAGRAGEFFLELPNRKSIREISLQEALEVVKRNEQAGLVNTGACFCCTDACEILYSLKRVNRWDLLGRSRYEAAVDLEKCTGCQTCVERCPFNAIMMQPSLTSKKRKAHALSWNCMGCGACILGCEQQAIQFELVRPPEHIPAQQPNQFSLAGIPGFTFIREEALK
jgi:NAD-dependent dihydropyrimidine dehydrogenase PreA subunit